RSFPSSGSRLLALLYWRGGAETKPRGLSRELLLSSRLRLPSSLVLTFVNPRGGSVVNLQVSMCI
uniref:Uncharacterized protein n=1 Tax=Aegilops tauschii subsp. strangulata TaxID=200361 RepID=A0A453AH88_AEGTS